MTDRLTAMSNAELVVAAQNGDLQAFERLLRDWYPQLIRFAAQYLKNEEAAQDVVQETLIKLTRNIGQLQRPEAFTSWVYTILRRDCVEYYRRERRFLHEQASLDAMPPGRELADNHVPFAPSVEMEQCLGRLRSEDRELLGLHYWCGLELREIAQLFGIAAGAMKTRLFRARGQLRELLALPGAG